MKKLCTITLCSVLFAGLYLAGCDTTTISNGDIDSSEQVGAQQSAAKGAKIDICHRRGDPPRYGSIDISVNAEAAHRAHGDGQIGDAVPDMAGKIFDETCAPIATTVCIDGGLEGLSEEELCGEQVHSASDSCELACGEEPACGGTYIITYRGELGALASCGND